MRYGREVTVGNQIRLTEVVEVPSGVADAQTWLATHMPHLSVEGWIQVGNDNISGAVKQLDDSYENPILPSETSSLTEGRDLTMGEFIKIGYALGIDTNIDTALKNMPSLMILLQQYQDSAGIRFADAQSPGTTLRGAFDKLKAATLIDDAGIQAFLDKWVEIYPRMALTA